MTGISSSSIVKLKKTENVKRSKSLQKLKNRIPGESEEDAKKTNLMRILEDGEKMREVNVFLNVNEHLVSSLTCGTFTWDSIFKLL
jgi:hypothetical protein